MQEVVRAPFPPALLLDPYMQRVLQECGDPALLRRHLANPATASKTERLCAAGLGGAAR